MDCVKCGLALVNDEPQLELLAHEDCPDTRAVLRVPIPSEVDTTFLQGMVNRMTTSYYVYGEVRLAYPKGVDALASLQRRLDRYHATGNTEFLIDAANFAMIEFMFPSRPDAHFTPTDGDASPGRQARMAGIPNRLNNKDIDTLARLTKDSA